MFLIWKGDDVYISELTRYNRVEVMRHLFYYFVLLFMVIVGGGGCDASFMSDVENWDHSSSLKPKINVNHVLLKKVIANAQSKVPILVDNLRFMRQKRLSDLFVVGKKDEEESLLRDKQIKLMNARFRMKRRMYSEKTSADKYV